MDNVIWRSIKVEDLFERTTPPATGVPAKQLTIFDEPTEGLIPLITRAETNNGIRGYIEKGGFPTAKNVITYNDQFSFFLYHEYEFTTIKDHLSIVEAKNEVLKDILSKYNYVCVFIVTILNHVFSKEIFNFNFTGAEYRFGRELVMLPYIEVTDGEDCIWEENGKRFTLAVSYIKKLMDEAKTLHEEKTINFYNSQCLLYTAKRQTYENEYDKARKEIVWKKFSVDSLFTRNTPPATGVPAKSLTVFEKPSDDLIPLITRAETNNGIVGYIEKEDFPTAKNAITYNDQFSFFLYHEYEFTTIKDHLSIIEAKNDKLKAILEQFNEVNQFIVTILNHVFSKEIFNFNFTGAEYRFGRELIMLPCLEVADGEEFIWADNGKHFTLAVGYIMYLYLSGRIEHYQKLINTYTYKY